MQLVWQNVCTNNCNIFFSLFCGCVKKHLVCVCFFFHSMLALNGSICEKQLIVISHYGNWNFFFSIWNCWKWGKRNIDVIIAIVEPHKIIHRETIILLALQSKKIGWKHTAPNFKNFKRSEMKKQFINTSANNITKMNSKCMMEVRGTRIW